MTAPEQGTDLVERLRQTAHDFELHDPERGAIYRGRCDVTAITEAADLIDRLSLAAPVNRNAVLDEILAKLPGGTHCDPQEIADVVRALKATSLPSGEQGEGGRAPTKSAILPPEMTMNDRDILIELLAIKFYEHDAQDRKWPSRDTISWTSISEEDRENYREIVRDFPHPESARIFDKSKP